MKDKIKILIVEDEVLTAKSIASQLMKMGYKMPSIAKSHDKAMSKIKKETFDLILLDVDLKHEQTGMDVANEKEVLNRIPIIYITGYKDSETLEEIMLTNPKSYLSKPLRYEELNVAVSLALASKLKMKKVVEMGHNFSYDLENQNLFCKKELVKLSKNEKLLLERLMDGNGEAISIKELEFSIWGYESKSENSLRTLVGSLRKKLNPSMIVTQRYFGYRLILPKK